MQRLKYYTLANSFFFLSFNLINSFVIALLFQNFKQSLLYSVGTLILIRIIYITLLPFAAKLIGAIGTRTSVIIGMIFLFLSTIPLFFIQDNVNMLLPWIMLMAISFTFYFLPISIFTSHYTESSTRGTQISTITTGLIFASGVTPIISGFIISKFAFEGFAVLLAVIIALGTIPFFKLNNFKFIYSGNILNIFRYNKSLLKASWIETCHFSTKNLSVMWTLYIFLFFGQDFKKFGIILTAITLFSAFLNISVGKFLNQHNRKDVLKIQVIFSPFSWVFRILANNTALIFFADAFHSLNSHLRESSVETTAFDLINRDEHKEILDEKIVVREILINLGIIITLTLAIILAHYFGIKASFVLGVIISFGYLKF